MPRAQSAAQIEARRARAQADRVADAREQRDERFRDLDRLIAEERKRYKEQVAGYAAREGAGQ